MLSPNHFSGTEEERAALETQLGLLYSKAQTGALFGPFANAVLFQIFGYDEAEPLQLHHNEGGYRDIDVVRYYGYQDMQVAGSHTVYSDYSGNLFDPDARRPHLLETPSGYEKMGVAVDSSTIRLQTRQLGETTKVRTFKVGTQVLLQGIVVAWQDPELENFMPEYAEERLALDEVTQFAETIRETHPQEFLTPEQEAPFLEVQEAFRQYNS